MRKKMSNSESIQNIKGLVEANEQAIEQKIPTEFKIYLICRDAWCDGFLQSSEQDWVHLNPLTRDEIYWRYRLIISASFISARLELLGKNSSQNELTNHTLLLLYDLLPNQELNFKHYIELERLAKQVMEKEGVASRPLNLITIAIIIAIVGGILYLIFN
jgi:hypothetical protein